MRRIGLQPLLSGARLVALAALVCVVMRPADAEAGRPSSAPGSKGLDAIIASKVHQRVVLKRDLDRGGCDKPVDDARMEGCRQLDAKLHLLAAELEELKARAGDAWTSEKEKAAEASAPQPAPRRPKPYTYRWRTNSNAGYRTLCVRLCDGFYYPISALSRPDSFRDEERACQSSCSTPAKLFYQPAPGEAADEMVALTGERYAELPNAYRSRTEYVDSCACKPKPWSAEAKAEYERRAVLAARTRAERIVAAGADEMAAILAKADLKVAQRTPRARDATIVKLGQYPAGKGLFWRYRAYRTGLLAQPQPGNKPPQRRLFLFRNRH